MKKIVSGIQPTGNLHLGNYLGVIKQKQRCLFGVFPVWLQLEDENGEEINEISGFWADIAIFVDDFLSFWASHLAFGMWDREEFVLFPYKENGCSNWFQAAWKVLLNK